MSTSAPAAPTTTPSNGTPPATNALAASGAPQVPVVGDNWWDDSGKFALIQRAGRMFAMSPLVPEQYQGEAGIGSCVIALNIANRMNADPLMVMQNLYMVHNRPGWSAQFMIACFNQTGRFNPIRYQFQGTEGKDDWGCVAWSTDRRTGDRIEGPLVTIKTSKDEGWYEKKGSKWKTIPRLMLMYRCASWLVRTHAPELTMGLQTVEEIRDTIDAEFVRVRPGLPDSRSMSDKLADALEGKRTDSLADQLEKQIYELKTLEAAADLADVIAKADVTDEQKAHLENLLQAAERQIEAG